MVFKDNINIEYQYFIHLVNGQTNLLIILFGEARNAVPSKKNGKTIEVLYPFILNRCFNMLLPNMLEHVHRVMSLKPTHQF